MPAPVIPAPFRLRPDDGFITVDNDSDVTCEPELSELAARFVADVAIDTGISLATGTGTGSVITLRRSAAGLEELPASAGVRADGADADERHGLRVAPEGIIAWGPTPEGIFRALTTLRQLLAARATGHVAELAAMTVIDTPRYAWRGLLVDVARTFHGPDTVRGVIDMLALYKMNVLHLHLTDDPGWRFEVPGWPRLIEIGARGATGERPGGYYTTDEVAELVDYAARRFVTIVPEVDFPGHSSALLAAYPELASGLSEGQRAAGAAGFQVGTIDHRADATWRLVTAAVSAAADQFSTSAFVHIGGDETWGMPDADHAAFVSRAIETVRARGNRAIGWQEISRGEVTPGDVVQYWIDPVEVGKALDAPELPAGVTPQMTEVYAAMLDKAADDIPTAVGEGATILVSPYSYVYLDRPYADPAADPGQADLAARLGMRAYPAATLRACLEWEPLDVTPAVDRDDQLAGVEAAIWCENIADRDELEFMLLPRLATVADKAWAPRDVTTWSQHRDSLAAQPAVWQRRGWRWFRATTVDWHGA